MQDGRTFPEIRAAHPFPWKTVMVANAPGRITVLDNNRQEVPLFTMLRVVELLTAAAQQTAPERTEG